MQQLLVIGTNSPNYHLYRKYVAKAYNISAPPGYDPSNETQEEIWRADVESTLAHVTVKFSSMKMEVNREIPVYDVVKLLSSVGGALSIFMGISTLSYLELGEFLVSKTLRRLWYLKQSVKEEVK